MQAEEHASWFSRMMNKDKFSKVVTAPVSTDGEQQNKNFRWGFLILGLQAWAAYVQWCSPFG